MWLQFLFVFSGHASVIEGKAPAYTGQTVQLLRYENYITYHVESVATSRIAPDGSFRFEWDPSTTDLFLLRIGTINAKLVVGKNSKYNVVFPELPKDKAFSIANVTMVELQFNKIDKANDINARLTDFNVCYEQFFADHLVEIASRRFQTQLDVFQADVKDRFAPCLPNAYFDHTLTYTFAQLQQLVTGNAGFQTTRKALFDAYIKNKPVQYRHMEYMRFLQDFYKGYFQSYIQKYGDKVLAYAINRNPNLAILDSALRRDDFLKNDQRLRELILIHSLTEAFHDQQFKQKQVIVLLDSIGKRGVFEENRSISRQVSHYLTRLSTGYPAPDFALTHSNGDTVKLSDFRGKHVYIDFWATWCKPCLEEMMMMKELQRKYHRQVEFISISIDKDPAAFEKFKTEHPEYKWTMLHFGGQFQLLRDYDIRALPSYFLVDEQGNLEQSPALRPSPSGTNKTIDATFHYIKFKQAPPKTKVGDRRNR